MSHAVRAIISNATSERLLSIGAEVRDDGVSFRLWAPHHQRVRIVLEGSKCGEFELRREVSGYWSGQIPGIGAGALYRIRLDDFDKLHADPASRFQPSGTCGPSSVVDPTRFAWSDSAWRGVARDGQVLYEMHIGTFTSEGTWRSAIGKLPLLRDLGITCLEVMPVNEFPGNFGWGYDGVNLFAPTHLYGEPDDFRAFVDAAHTLGLGVILDVVYNHLGPDGNNLIDFAPEYFSATHHNDWGKGMNFDGPLSRESREYFMTNAQHWIAEYHLDGFRFDATQAIHDESLHHILTAITDRARAAAKGRELLFVAENEPQDARIARAIEDGGLGLSALWNDDFHHSAMVALSGHREAYFTDYSGTPQELISAAKWGYLLQGQHSKWQKKRRGTPALDLTPTAFIHFIQNHDQIANSGRGLRAHEIAGGSLSRAMSALLLLSPQTPMLFQGEEFASSAPFFYFADHRKELAPLIRAGRAKELSQFWSLATPAMQSALAAPDDPNTFSHCKLDWAERDGAMHEQIWRMHKTLLKIRREDAVFARVARRGDVDGAVLGTNAFLLRFFGEQGDDRLLLVNLGTDLTLDASPEPLLAPPLDSAWSLIFSTEDPIFGGTGTPAPVTENEGWHLTGRCAMLLSASRSTSARVETRHLKR